MRDTLPIISFGKLEAGMPMPHLLDIQIKSFEALLATNGAGNGDVGLERVFHEVFPITDVNENYALEYVKFSLGEPKYTVEECIERDMTYSASWSRSCTARPAWCSRRRSTPTGSGCTARASSRSAARGSSSPSTSTTWSTSTSTRRRNSPRQHSSARLDMERMMRSCSSSMRRGS